MNARIVDSSGMNRFSQDWKISEIVQDKDVKVFSTFSCGGAVHSDTKELDSM